MRNQAIACSVYALVTMQGACSSTDSALAPAPAAVRPNYNEDVVPVLSAKCFRCHTSDGLGGVSLDSYGGALAASESLRHVVIDRHMPPWGIDETGGCGSWRGSPALLPAEATTLLAWLAAGRTEGDPGKRRLLSSAGMEALGPAATSFDVGAGFQPRPGAGTSRCFFVDPRMEADQLVTGMSFSSDVPFGIQQVSVFALDSPESVSQALALEAADPRPGYACAGGSNIASSRFVASASVAAPVVRLPEGTGIKLTAETKMVVEVDYNLFAASVPHGARVTLEKGIGVREAVWTDVRAPKVSIAPGHADTTAEAAYVTPSEMTILAVQPNMRLFGKGMSLTAAAPQGRGLTCLFNQTNWYFHMLRVPRSSAAPQRIASQSLLTLTCHYDTRGNRVPIREGDTFDDEECGVRLYTTR